MQAALLAGLVPSLVALAAVSNVVPILPVVQDYTAELEAREARAYRLRALLQGNLVALGFIFGAPLLLAALALTVDDLRVAGGVVLLAYATHDLLFSRQRRNRRQVGSDEESGPPVAPPVAPLGVPIFVGPATLSMLLVLSEVHGPLTVTVALVANLLLNVVLLSGGDRILELLGEGASRAVGKVMSLLLATLGAGMLRAGIQGAVAAAT